MKRHFGKHQGGAEQDVSEQYQPEEIGQYDMQGNAAGEELSSSAQEDNSEDYTATGEDSNYIGRTPDKRKKLSGFSRFLLIYSAAFLVVVAVALVFFWKYIAAYEISRPEHEMDDVVLAMETYEGSSDLAKVFVVSDFEDKDTVFSDIYSTYIEGQSCTYRKMAGEYTDDTPVYVLRAGSTDWFKLSLKPKGENAAGYGFQLWELSTLELLKENTRTVTILVPPGASVSVNGIAVSDDYITDDHVEYEDLTEQEKRFNADFDAYRVLYTIDNIYGKVEVSVVDAEGTELVAESDDESDFVYDAVRYSVKLTAPADAVVTINGVELKKEDATGSLLSSDMFKGLEKYATAVPDFAVYEIDGLFAEPEIAAKDAKGAELEPTESSDGGFVFGLPDSTKLKEAQTQRVTDFVKSYVSFSTDEKDDTNGNFTRLSKFLLTNTETYKRIKNSVEGVSWVSGGTIEYKKLELDNFVACGDNCYVVRATISITVTSDGNVRNTDSVYTLVFVKSGGVWLVGNMLAS
ncbi:MAG: nuclear transport factor 2 family protein [Clostridia bacterium]|nr:nuclear transport factor 2 family protein [Clostridia bacterium]